MPAKKTTPATATPAAEPQAKPPAEKPGPVLVENLMAPEIFAAEMTNVSLINGIISIALSSSRYDYSVSPCVMKKVVVYRLVMPPDGAQKMAVQLYAFLNKNGFGPAGPDKEKLQ